MRRRDRARKRRLPGRVSFIEESTASFFSGSERTGGGAFGSRPRLFAGNRSTSFASQSGEA